MPRPDRIKKRLVHILAAALLFQLGASPSPLPAQTPPGATGRERLLMDSGWRFAFGHPSDARKDFGTGTGYFSYLAKTGYGDGAAATDFDDRAWRSLNLPHDWAVEVPFDGRGSHSHGYKAIGRNFPDTSVGWYRKSFFIPNSDLGRRISIEFDGVFRDSKVWVNGHYLGNHPSGYSGFAYNLGEFLNYGGNNVIAVRADATMEEGWFYEGAGIYRHVWLTKTTPLHVERHGAFVTTEVTGGAATVRARVSVINENTNAAEFEIEQTIVDPDGKTLAHASVTQAKLQSYESGEFSTDLPVSNPQLWSIETPRLHKLVTTIHVGDAIVDRYETPFGIRTIRFDPNEGFFLNGQRVELKGANVHQDHAGVGVALPDALQDFRISQLKTFGANAYRCSHHPPTPELLDACDRLGMVVIVENRLMGTSADQLDELKELILRDRNHPGVILWSLGNEEWNIEGNPKGARIAATMQAFAKHLDPSRRTTVAISGGWGGISTVIDVAGYNYIKQSNSDKQHKDFPDQPGVGTEETTTQQTRGIYFDDKSNAHLAPLEKGDTGGNCEAGWKYYAARPFLAGLFYWTGFDYRGEETPFGYPAISSQFGILDLCGFPKDSFFYLKSWWIDQPMLHVTPHWNWPGKDGQEIPVTCFGNCEEVELFLNGQSLGRKTMEKNSHLEWKVKYAPGTLLARGFNGGKEILSDKIETTSDPSALQLSPQRATLNADGEDVSVITVQASDAHGRSVPTAGNKITFEISGPGKIIGVGNGDPSSHEADQFFPSVSSLSLAGWRMKFVDRPTNLAEIAFETDDSNWPAAFAERGGERRGSSDAPTQTTVYRGSFESPQNFPNATFALLLRSLGEQQSVYLNGQPVAENVSRANAAREINLPANALRSGKNVIAIIATPPAKSRGNRGGEFGNQLSPGLVRVTAPPAPWTRSLFNGLAQIIVQSTGQPGEITLTAHSPGVADGVLKLTAKPAKLRAALP